MPFLASEGCFCPLTDSIASEVKNDHAHVTSQRIFNKFIEVNFSVGCTVWPWCCLFQPLTTSKTINKTVLKNILLALRTGIILELASLILLFELDYFKLHNFMHKLFGGLELPHVDWMYPSIPAQQLMVVPWR